MTRRSSLLLVAVVFAVLTIGAVAVSGRLFLLFDEAYNLNLSKTLAQDGVYASHTAAGYMLFDPSVTTGPTLAVPLAAAMRVAGASVAVARAAMLVIFLLCLVLVFAAAREIAGRAAAVPFLVLFYTTPLVLVYGLSALGDVLAISLALASIALLNRSARATRPGALLLGSGVMLGLAVLAKDSTLLLLPALALVCVWDALRREARLRRAVANLTPAVIAGLMVVGWRGYELAAVRQSSSAEEVAAWQSMTANVAQMLGRKVMFAPFSHLAAGAQSSFTYIGPLLLSLGLAGVVFVLLRGSMTPDEPLGQSNLGLRVTAGAAAVWFVWFFLISGPEATTRHLLPGIVFAEVLAARLLVLVWQVVVADGLTWRLQNMRTRRVERRQVAQHAAAVLVTVCLLWAVVDGVGFVRLYLDSSTRRLAMQRTATAWIEQNTPTDAVLSGWGWYVPWSLAYMADRTPGRVILETPELSGLSDWFVLCPEVEWGGSLDERLRDFLARQGAPVVNQRLYPVYRVTWRP